MSLFEFSSLRFELSHSVLDLMVTKTFSLSLSIQDLKDALHLIVGTPTEYMRLDLHFPNGDWFPLREDGSTLGSYRPCEGCRIHIHDDDPNQTVASYSDTSKVEKYEISDDAYEKREGTFRKWKQSRPDLFKSSSEKSEKEIEEEIEAELSRVSHVQVGSRCRIRLPESPLERRGVVRYCGFTKFKQGVWVGVQLDEPTGKNNGCVDGEVYFSCPPTYGLFVRPEHVECGDFPEQSLDDLFDEM